MESFIQQAINQNEGDVAGEIEQSFQELDTDRNGEISREELVVGMKAFGINPTENQLDDIMNHIDTDGDGVITLKEYKRVVHEVFGENELFSVKTDDLEYTFSLFRRNQGGTATNISENESLSIDLEEFFDVLKLGLEHSGAVREDIVGKEVGVLKEFQTDLIQMHKEFIENDYNYSHINIGYIQNLPFARTESLLHFFKSGGEILQDDDTQQ